MEEEQKPMENVQLSQSPRWQLSLSSLGTSEELPRMHLGIILLNVKSLGYLSTNPCDPVVEGCPGHVDSSLFLG